MRLMSSNKSVKDKTDIKINVYLSGTIIKYDFKKRDIPYKSQSYKIGTMLRNKP